MSLTSHQRPNRGASDEWLTPPEIVQALGPFHLDPCAAVNQPWKTAKVQYTIEDGGLSKRWAGFVWCNPPFGLRKRPHFHYPDGVRAPFNSGAPICLVAYGLLGITRIRASGLEGTLVTSWT